MILQWLFLGWMVLASSCTGLEAWNHRPVARPIFSNFSSCSMPPFSPRTTVEAYRQHLLKVLMNVFRRRDPDDRVGGPQVASACTQAVALLETYHSLSKAYLDYQMNQEVQSGMVENSAAWMAARLNMMEQEDITVKQNKNLAQCVRWCMDACLVMQQMLSQRAFSEMNESPTSPGNAFSNLLDASQAGDISHTERATQYMLAKCRDESKPVGAENNVWAALSVGIAENFFYRQLECAINTQRGTEEEPSLVKALLALSWGDMDIREVLAPHNMLVHSVRNVSSSKLLTDSDKKRIKKNCSAIGLPQLQPFWPMIREPEHYDEAVVALYSLPPPEATGQQARETPEAGSDQPASSPEATGQEARETREGQNDQPASSPEATGQEAREAREGQNDQPSLPPELQKTEETENQSQTPTQPPQQESNEELPPQPEEPPKPTDEHHGRRGRMAPSPSNDSVEPEPSNSRETPPEPTDNTQQDIGQPLPSPEGEPAEEHTQSSSTEQKEEKELRSPPLQPGDQPSTPSTDISIPIPAPRTKKSEAQNNSHSEKVPQSPRRPGTSIPSRIRITPMPDLKPMPRDENPPAPEEKKPKEYTRHATVAPKLPDTKYLLGHRLLLSNSKEVPGAVPIVTATPPASRRWS